MVASTKPHGRKINHQLRDGTPMHMYLPGPHRGVWNVEALASSRDVILCEALIDAMTFWCTGFRNVTASYGVEGFTDDHVAAFRKHGTGGAGRSTTSTAPSGALRRATTRSRRGTSPTPSRRPSTRTRGCHWWGAFRRAALVALTVADVAHTREGVIFTLRRSKTDQEGKGALTGVPYAMDASLCAVRALEAWLTAAQITEGPLFRSIDHHGRMSAKALGDRNVALIVQRAALVAGLDPTRLGGHSLRAGFATTAARAGRSLDAINHLASGERLFHELEENVDERGGLDLRELVHGGVDAVS